MDAVGSFRGSLFKAAPEPASSCFGPARMGNKGMVLMSTSTYIMLLTLFLTEGGTLEAEQEVSAATLQECRIEAQKQQAALRREFALSVEERGMCPFRDVQITCVRKQGGK